MSERVKHPSFANLYIGRSQSSGKVALFGSSIKHHDIINLRISPAFMDRDLNYDRYYAENLPYIEIAMSQSQFAKLGCLTLSDIFIHLLFNSQSLSFV